MTTSHISNPAIKRALIVIDVQNEYFTGNMLIEYPDPQVSLSNIGRAMDAAKAANIPVLVVQHSAPETSPSLPVVRKAGNCIKWSPAAMLTTT